MQTRTIMALPLAVLLALTLATPLAGGAEDAVYRATIGNVQTLDKESKIIGSGETGEPIILQSKIDLNEAAGYDEDLQNYIYYAQIKVAEKDPYVEYVGVYEGVLETSGAEIAWIMWTPERPGLYYVETYVWDGMVPLTSPGPVSIILVN